MGKHTLSDIAERAGVSSSTVSRVLNGNSMISAKTARKVLDIAEELNYAPDLRFRWMAQVKGEQSAKTGNIGFLAECSRWIDSTEVFMSDSYYSRMFMAVEEGFSQLDHNMLLSIYRNAEYYALPKFVKDLRVDGVLYSGYDKSMVERISKVMPIVVLNMTFDLPEITSFMPDEASGIRKAMDYFRELGHEKIYFFDIIGDYRINLHHSIRRQAFSDYIQENLMSEAQLKIIESNKPSIEVVHDQLVEWLQLNDMPTAVICASDSHALSFLEAAEKLGVDVPGELSVIGADNTMQCEFSRPKLTSIKQPLEEMSIDAAKKIVQMANLPVASEHILYDVKLIKRESCSQVKCV